MCFLKGNTEGDIMLKSLKRYHILNLLGVFCLLYNPPILPFNSMHLVGAISIAYLGLHYRMLPQLFKQKRYVNLIFFFVFLLIYLLMVGLSATYGSLAIAYFPMYFLLDVIPFGLSVSLYHKKRGLQTADFTNLVLCVAAFQALLAAFSYFVPQIQDFFISRFVAYGYGEVYVILSRHRMYGFAGGLTYSTPILQSFLAIIAMVKAQKEGYRFLFLAALLLFSAVINARVSIVVLAIGIVIMTLYGRISWKKKLVLLLSAGIAGILGISIILPVVASNSPQTYEWILKGIEEIVAFLRGNTEGYFGYVADPAKYVLPDSAFAMLFGEGHSIMSGTEGYGLQSDIGYINDIWTGGIVYVIVLYSFVTSCLIRLYKNNNELISFVGILGIALYPFLNIKGIICNMNDMTVFVMLLFVVSLQKENKEAG